MVGMLFFLFLIVNCFEKELNFIVKGNLFVIKDIKINIEMFKDSGIIIVIVYYNGKSYIINNVDVLCYKIYVLY